MRFALAAALMLTLASAVRAERRVLDDFRDPSRWRAVPAAGVALALAADRGETGAALRLDFDFQGHAGYAVAHRDMPLDLPANWALSFRLRGEAPVENLEIKLIDPSGDNVWWVNRRDFVLPREWTTVRVLKRQLVFAWGPRGGGELTHAAALEIAVTAGSGGRGSVWIADLVLTELPPPHPYTLVPQVTADGPAAPGAGPERALDGDPATAWRPLAAAAATLTVDFGEPRDLGGLTLRWPPGRYARRFALDVSDDGAVWTTAREVERGRGGRNDLRLPETTTRWLRLRLLAPGGQGYGLAELEVRPLAFGATANDFFLALAAEAPRGTYPRGFSGEQSEWTVVGADGGSEIALLSEDGALEPGSGAFSIEPFLLLDGRRIGWSEVAAEPALADGYLPMPSVAWTAGDLRLEIAAFADAVPDASGAIALAAHYRLRNLGAERRAGRLWLTVRPFQVNPPAQFLGRPGGVAPIASLACASEGVRVEGTRVIALPPPETCAATGFDEGPISALLAEPTLLADRAVEDAAGFASAALGWSFDLASGSERELWVTIPTAASAALPLTAEALAARRAATAAHWHATLDRVTFSGPPAVAELAATLRSNLAYLLVLRHGPALHPGARAYARAWIRDGALMAEALLRLDHAAEARAFAEWFVGYQCADGKVPCCVDRRGADPVPENDSGGELIHLLAEIARVGGDRATTERLFPHVEAAVAALDALRRERRTPAYRTPERRAYFGLLPESISHEGYSAKPMHSYWDDFWAARGFADAVELARTLERPERVAKWTAIGEEFRADLLASLRRTMAEHRIRYLPGCVELGDFDATSTAIALAPGGLQAELPRAAVERTFERYWQSFVRRRDGRGGWDAYTPYELRLIGTFVRLGWRARAHQALAWFLGDRRPPAWNQWPEVVHRERRTPHFVGDLPHGWVGAEMIRSVLDLFAYERPAERALVLGAGLPAAWLATAEGVAVRGLATPWGRLDYHLRTTAEGVRWELGGGMVPPPGGLVLTWPLAGTPRRATIDAEPVPLLPGGELVVRALPAAVVVSR